MAKAPLVLLAAGGTGGHLFPAEATAVALRKLGAEVALATDTRAVTAAGATTDRRMREHRRTGHERRSGGDRRTDSDEETHADAIT